MTTEIDTLATARYVHVDDLLKASPDLGPWRPRIGLAPKLSDAEPVTLAVMPALLGFTSERRRLRCAQAELAGLSPCLPGRSGDGKRRRKASALVTRMIRMLGADTSLWSDDVWVADCTPVECGRSRETVKRSDLAGWTTYGYWPGRGWVGRPCCGGPTTRLPPPRTGHRARQRHYAEALPRSRGLCG
ncbi:hypothetical protein ABT356_13635 [Streptosporangium roseum]